MSEQWKSLPYDERIAAAGHRSFVGGPDAESWYGFGKLQFHMLVEQGLRPEHRFLDVACGSLRLGQFLIPYLEADRYVGLDVAQELIDAGLEHELSAGIVAMKRPSFIVSDRFELGDMAPFDMALAQSLFTHLTLDDIAVCAQQLRPATTPGSRFLFTFHRGDGADNPTGPSDPQANWLYSFDEIKAPFEAADWDVLDIGDWGHPRGQQLAEARPR